MKYSHLVIIGFIVWFTGTVHGGFSDSPQSDFEKITDVLGWILMLWGLFGDITSNLKISKEITNTGPVYYLFEDPKETIKHTKP